MRSQDPRILPLGPEESEVRLKVDWARCDGHGLCAKIAPEMVQLDSQGYPAFLDMPVPFWLEREAQQAVEMCPAMALSLGSGSAGSLTPRGPARPSAPRSRLGCCCPAPPGEAAVARRDRGCPAAPGNCPAACGNCPGAPRNCLGRAADFRSAPPAFGFAAPASGLAPPSAAQ